MFDLPVLKKSSAFHCSLFRELVHSFSQYVAFSGGGNQWEDKRHVGNENCGVTSAPQTQSLF
jgi:hypothetical protein